jgi:hypothetical protein
VTFAADNAELSERTIGCRRMQARVHFSKASRSAESSLPSLLARRALEQEAYHGNDLFDSVVVLNDCQRKPFGGARIAVRLPSATGAEFCPRGR